MNAKWLLLAMWPLGQVSSAQLPPSSSGTVVITPGSFEVSGTRMEVDEGRLVVPANRTSGSLASLTLSFVRFRSSAAAPSSPIVFLAGGPGDAATRAFRGMPVAFLRELLSIADVIAFDQRGTGGSEPRSVLCPPGPALPRDRPADPSTMLDAFRRRVDDCLIAATARNVDVRGLTTAESADDLEALRIGLGADRLTFLAGSYGTHLALTAAARHPALVDRMALLGVEGPDDTFKLPTRVHRVLEVISEARRPSLPDDVRELVGRLSSEPARFTFSTGQEIVLGEWDLRRWVAESLDAISEIDTMLAAIPAMLDGQFAALAQWALRYRISRPINLMNLAMDCASYASEARLARIRSESPTVVLGDVINFPLPDVCEMPGLPRLPDQFRAPLQSNVRALLVSGTFDGRTPPQNATDVLTGLPRGRSLAIDGASHGLFREPMVLQSVLAFFREKE